MMNIMEIFKLSYIYEGIDPYDFDSYIEDEYVIGYFLNIEALKEWVKENAVDGAINVEECGMMCYIDDLSIERIEVLV